MTFIEALSLYPRSTLPGKRFRRSGWASEDPEAASHVETNTIGIMFYVWSDRKVHLNLAVDDMLATDWEEVK